MDNALDIPSGIWQHYSGNKYLVLGVGRALQFRPLKMWQEIVCLSGRPNCTRFVYLGPKLEPKGIENDGKLSA